MRDELASALGAHHRCTGRGPLQRLRELRQRRPRDVSITSLIESQKRQAGKAQQQIGELAELWAELVPEPLRMRTSLLGMRGGVLHVAADSSSVAFELDRCLRESLLSELRNRYHSTLMRVKVQLKSAEGNSRRGGR